MVLKQRDASVEPTEEYEQFIAKLQEFHEKRGTVFEAKPKVGPRHLDLLKLYTRIVEDGGYDRVSDTKTTKLGWRKVAMDFMPHNVNIVQMAFLVKTAYYKNLAAYEIAMHWKQEPPPKEILEDLSARGGDLLTRTLENFQPRIAREQEALANGEREDGSEDEHRTPKDSDKMDIDEPSTGRATRGLRQAPPQRVLFGSSQDPSAGRSGRSGASHNSPTPGGSSSVNGTYTSSGAALTISNYEPRAAMPATVKPVSTPASQPAYYRDIARKLLAQRRKARPSGHVRGTPMLPGTGYTGANIYQRALFALQSDQPAEIRYALHHLVKISHERGDKYMFEQFPGLAEALINQALKVSSLFYKVRWRVSYEDSSSPENDVLNALHGTPDILRKLQTHQAHPFVDNLQTEDFALTMSCINEAGLVLRNMSMLEGNAGFLVTLPLLRDLLVIVLNLPPRPAVVELQHYALDIAEQVTKFLVIRESDPLYISLLAQLQSEDRGAVITSLRALSRIALKYEAPNRLANVPVNTLQRIDDWLLLEDEELRSACLDFLYQYTAVTENVERMLKDMDVGALTAQLVGLLMHGAHLEKEKPTKHYASTLPSGKAAGPPKLSAKIIDSFIAAIPDERELSSAWLRSCFEEDTHGEITQLALWSAYNEAFAQAKLTRPLMQAKDFITNVSNTFTHAQAQVVYTDPDPSKPKYTIRGVRPRTIPLDLRGRPFLKCLWKTPAPTTNGFRADTPKDTPCEFSAQEAKEIQDHVMSAHLHIQRDANGQKYDTSSAMKKETNGDTTMDGSDHPPSVKRFWSCHWATCSKIRNSSDLKYVVRHVATHLPDSSKESAFHKQHNVPPEKVEIIKPLERAPWSHYTTELDDKNQATGLPLASMNVLRNLARQITKIDDGIRASSGREEHWMERCFGPIRERLGHVGAWNRTLKDLMPPLEFLVEKGLGGPTLPPTTTSEEQH